METQLNKYRTALHYHNMFSKAKMNRLAVYSYLTRYPYGHSCSGRLFMVPLPVTVCALTALHLVILRGTPSPRKIMKGDTENCQTTGDPASL